MRMKPHGVLVIEITTNKTMDYCVYLQRMLDNEIPTYVEVDPREVILIPRQYSEEENVFETDVANLKANFPELAVAMMNRTPYRLELPLSSITKICPRNRQRIDSYDRLKRYLLTKGVELIVYSQKTKKN